MEVIGVTHLIKTETLPVEAPVNRPVVYCDFCKNDFGKCHDYLFGEFLLQETVTWFEDKEEEEQKVVTSGHVQHEIKWNYNRHLNFRCWGTKYKYDNNCWHNIPQCLMTNTVGKAINLIKNMQLLAVIKSKREGGAARKYTMYPETDNGIN